MKPFQNYLKEDWFATAKLPTFSMDVEICEVFRTYLKEIKRIAYTFPKGTGKLYNIVGGLNNAMSEFNRLGQI